MERAGFYRHGLPTTGVTEVKSLRADNQNFDKRIKYSAVIDPEKLNATAIFELSGSPCIYFTQLDQVDPDPRELARLHKLSWNHGLAPMLWVITPNKVLLYNCYSKPTEEDRNEPDQTRHLIDLFENTEAGLKRMNELASRHQIESGEFWKWEKAKQIDRKQRVDAVLVEDLTQAENKLVKEKGLERPVAHALLIRAIFVAYLQDRGILNEHFFRKQFKVDNFTKALDNQSATYDLFAWIQRTFNGDIFPISSLERESVKEPHLQVVKSLICGSQEISTGQRRLWRAYDFKVIPVELISSIYEKFIYATDAKSAEEISTHYTPINLVDLVLSEVFKKLEGNSKILDIACGSGVFLVESLRRLVVKRWANGEDRSRQLVRDTLYNQIYGVDLNPKAVQIAAFSLYLTALELDYELEQNPQLSDNLKFRKLIDNNLFSSDAFNEEAAFNKIEPFANKQFGAIVGNPPWTKSKSNQLAAKYCARKRPESGYPDGYPIARSDNPDQAFLWRIGDFANDNTRIGLILHGKPFFSPAPKARKAKEALLMRFKPLVLINLSKLRNDKLFPNSTAPAVVLIAENSISKAKDSFYFVCPEHSSDFRRHGIIEISAENIKRLPVYGVASDPDMLKVASWGQARDFNIVQLLRKSFPPLVAMLSKDGWASGRGFFAGTNGTEKPELYGKKWLPSGKMPKYQIDMTTLQPLVKQKLARSRNTEIYKSPLVITTRGLKASGFFAAFSQEDVIYVDTYIGISVPPDQVDIAHYLNGIFNSSITTYYLFLTASSWGIERDEIKTQDLERLPVPLANGSNQRIINQIIDIEGQLREARNKDIHAELKKQLDQAVFNLYGLDETEQIIVNDTINITIDLWMKRKKSAALRRPQTAELEAYAVYFISVIQPFLQTLNERTMVADVFNVGQQAPLQVVKFSIVPAPGREPVVQTVPGQKLQTILRRIAEQLPQKIADRIYTRRDLRIYLGEDLYIIKPAQLRYWSRSTGLNDADTVLAEHLRVNHASIG
jgi:hypothetical protein